VERREFITLLGGAAAAAWPLAGRAQQSERMRRIGVLMTTAAADPAGQARLTAFRMELETLGWTDGRNIHVHSLWGAAHPDDLRKYAAELVAFAPDVILATGSYAVEPLLQATRSIPIVFVTVIDPVGGGFVESLARPGGNATGFILFEYGLSGKWLELLKQIAPGATRAAIIRDAVLPASLGQLGAIQAVAPSFGVELSLVNIRDAAEIERAVAAFARSAGGGIIVTASPLASIHRDLIVSLVAQHKLPAVYYDRQFVTAGGLLSYGPNIVDQYRLGAVYVDRILKGENPGDLPVQAPTKYELVINLKTAKALGLKVSSSLLARADEVIE
jgi:putative tryptophan/tyrosine transport system substrate-binding protein